MSVHTEEGIAERIRAEVNGALNDLPLWLRWWVRAHLIDPRPIYLCTNAETGAHGSFWLVTDHVGMDDAPFRVVYDSGGFGLEMMLEDGLSYLVHRASSFAEAVECM
jgi:hypothetical protein